MVFNTFRRHPLTSSFLSAFQSLLLSASSNARFRPTNTWKTFCPPWNLFSVICTRCSWIRKFSDLLFLYFITLWLDLDNYSNHFPLLTIVRNRFLTPQLLSLYCNCLSSRSFNPPAFQRHSLHSSPENFSNACLSLTIVCSHSKADQLVSSN